MDKYVGIHTQISRNNRLSILYLLAFPALILATVYAFLYFVYMGEDGVPLYEVNQTFTQAIPYVIIVVLIWFLIAYWSNTSMIKAATGSKTLSRKENMRVYNLVENLCMTEGMRMPKINVIEDSGLNAFASGINENTYTVTLTRGIIDQLNNEELEGVIAHELMHIKNRDVRLLIITIIFVGIFSFLMQMAFRNILYSGGRRKNNKDSGKAMLIALVITAIAYFLSLIFKFGLSRKREYMADSGAADMTKNPRALASALRKIKGNSQVKSVKSSDVKELFIDNVPDESAGFMGGISGLFSTHPPIDKRIALLEQF
ncbi:MAG: M48 family metallopeptidase [Flavobacteriales bacterium]